MKVIQISDRIYVEVIYYYIVGYLTQKVLKSVAVSLECSTWVKTSVLLESDLKYLNYIHVKNC